MCSTPTKKCSSSSIFSSIQKWKVHRSSGRN
ncbi:hypothetical protein BDFB_012069 [Asbolus verrucosus]|uniref:Uncharacterized protein n=1 Tax=Asbolus verrucosus TaxID=1661398 RepID=A0A482VKT5_ASBVE|nr:hypothetical protein BDFB_012069 [Asbolus verrucosus]